MDAKKSMHVAGLARAMSSPGDVEVERRVRQSCLFSNTILLPTSQAI